MRTKKLVEHIYEPRGACKEVMECRDEEVLISGSAGTGKSRACLEKILAVCSATPNVRALILRKTARSLGSTALVTWRNFVVKEALQTGWVTYYGGSQQEAAQYRFKNGSTVTIGGLDNPMRVMSSEYDIVYIQEATEITVEDLEMVKTRLRNWTISFQQVIMDCNPNSDQHWLYLRATGKEKITTLFISTHEDNPRLFDLLPDGTYQVTDRGAKYIAILDKLTGVRYKRLRLGMWVSAEGIIYEEFNRAVHVIPWDYDEEGNRLPLPLDWERYWVIDFGYSHPFVLKCYAEDPEDGALYCYREIHMTQRIVEEHASQIMSIVTRDVTTEWFDHFNKVMRKKTTTEWIEPKPVAVICDHDAEGRKTFERHTGLGTVAANKAVSEGIDLVKARYKVDEYGLARLYYMDDILVEVDEWLVENLLPVDSLGEIGGYAWKFNKAGKPLDEPVKESDDGMDCDRYLVMHKDYRGAPRATLIDA